MSLRTDREAAVAARREAVGAARSQRAATTDENRGARADAVDAARIVRQESAADAHANAADQLAAGATPAEVKAGLEAAQEARRAELAAAREAANASYRQAQEANFASTREAVKRADEALRSDLLNARQEALGRRIDWGEQQGLTHPTRTAAQRAELARIDAAKSSAGADGFNAEEARLIRERQVALAGRVHETNTNAWTNPKVG